MNLLQQPWFRAVQQGRPETITFSQIADPKITDLAFTRPDLNGAVYQWLIGMLQTAMAPANIMEWKALYMQPPNEAELSRVVEPFVDAFELLPESGPAFMQDLALESGESKSVAALLIEAPGGKTIKDNTDHFVKRGIADKICPSCAAAALYCLQSAAPSGGVGHRTSLRGGGGLTTLVLPDGKSTLWQKLWFNVIPKDDPTFNKGTDDIFPWLAPTRTSEKKGSEVRPDQVSPLQMYWAMPRRIRFDLTDTVAGHCDLCGCEHDQLLTHYTTKNYGPNYAEGFTHVLTPYRLDLKGKKPPLSVKGKQGGLAYRDWLGIAIGEADPDKPTTGEQPAKVVEHFITQKRKGLSSSHRKYSIWCFAYDMDNMKARGWYEHRMPLIEIPATQRNLFVARVVEYIEFAKQTVSALRQAVKQAWSNRPKDLKGDLGMVEAFFWQETEAAFFAVVQQLAENFDAERQLACDQRWRAQLLHQLNIQFEHWALDRFDASNDLPRIIAARQSLHKLFYSAKHYKNINKRLNDAKKEIA